MTRTKFRIGLLLTGLVIGIALEPPIVHGQGPFAAQIQNALRTFLRTAHTWTATQTFSTITVTSCTGCGSVAGSDTQVQFNDGGSAFGANAGFVFVKSTDQLGLTGSGASLLLGTDTTVARTGTGTVKLSSASLSTAFAVKNSTNLEFGVIGWDG